MNVSERRNVHSGLHKLSEIELKFGIRSVGNVDFFAYSFIIAEEVRNTLTECSCVSFLFDNGAFNGYHATRKFDTSNGHTILILNHDTTVQVTIHVENKLVICRFWDGWGVFDS